MLKVPRDNVTVEKPDQGEREWLRYLIVKNTIRSRVAEVRHAIFTRLPSSNWSPPVLEAASAPSLVSSRVQILALLLPESNLNLMKT